MLGRKMKGEAGRSSSISPMVSFVLGAAMATVCVLFFMSASPGRSLVDVAAWSHNNGTATQYHHLRSVAHQDDTARNLSAVVAPALAPVQMLFGAVACDMGMKSADVRVQGMKFDSVVDVNVLCSV